MTQSKLTLPATDADVLTVKNVSDEHAQGVVLWQSDGSGPITATAGVPVTLASLPAGSVAVTAVPADPFGANADAASVSGSISAKLRELATNGVILKGGTDYVGKVRPTDGSNDLTLLDLTNSKPFPVGLVDSNGNQLPLPPPIFPTITPTQSTSPAYAAGDNIAGTAQAIANAAASSGGSGHLLSLTFIDKDDLVHDGTNGAYYAHIFNASVTPGTVNAAFAVASDTEAARYIGTIDTDDGTWYDLGPAKVCTVFPPGGPIPYRCIGSTSLYICLVAKKLASGVATASGLDIVPHLVLD